MNREGGFTIVELLIVIVVIGILAAITIVSYNGVNTRARATAISTDFKSIEKSLKLYKASRGFSLWPIDNDSTYVTGNSNSSIQAIINAQPEFKAFMQEAPTAEGLGSSTVYQLDSDADAGYDGCSATSTGVNIFVADVTNTSLAQAVDDAMDDGNLSCGKLRQTNTGSLHYNIARTRDS